MATCFPTVSEHVLLEPSGLVASRLGMGCWLTGGHGWGDVDSGLAKAAIHTAFELGITLFDTADVYGFGRSERALAEALGRWRHDVVIATKCGVRWSPSGRTTRDLNPAYVHRAVEGSLRRLRLDRIPLYFAHWPDHQTPVELVMETLLRLRDQGKIQAIGLSNFSPPDVRAALQMGPVEAIQVEFSLACVDQLLGYMDLLRQWPVRVIAWGTLARGLLTGKYRSSATFPETDSRSRDAKFQSPDFYRHLRTAGRVSVIGARLGLPNAAVALRWVLDSPGVNCALFGARDPGQVKANLRATGWKLSASDYDYLWHTR